ncbi:NADPH-dependent 1-acyldihydroxyacetone phosphate reductase [Dactylonectria macrodidyma]|uniref:NADPH-dependent 1-acyldihydroxyacetone phosphate reductase n=1 Tax=Dactylonectria macrodidyma TaxID=307937 RepID=A0A9P9ER75_9HYPO|nr:NADPH-dependent 1-acyldihydroxyacetone phosphate reductase [Dactylonectria macrodidyma]
MLVISHSRPESTSGLLRLQFVNRCNPPGFQVIATARRPHLLNELVDAGMSVVSLDVTSADGIASCRKEVGELTNGHLYILTFEANVFGIMAMVQAFAPLLIKARGLIIMISSLSSLSPYVFGSVYCATKGALNSYSRTLRQELRPFGVKLMVSLTGTVKSQIAKADRSNSTVETSEYARRPVDEAVKGDGWLGGWIGGTAKWLLFGEWLLDETAYKQFGLNKLEVILRQRGKKLE